MYVTTKHVTVYMRVFSNGFYMNSQGVIPFAVGEGGRLLRAFSDAHVWVLVDSKKNKHLVPERKRRL
jgi:hypothetical protein